MSTLIRCTVMLVAFGLLLPFQALSAEHKIEGQLEAAAGPNETVEKATAVFEDIMKAPEGNTIPTDVLDEAQAVVVVPNLVKAGFIAGGRHGTGIMVNHQEKGGWSPPIFVSISGASVGAQLGMQTSDVVLVFNSRESVAQVLEGNNLTLGADASITGGPVDAEAAATIQDADVYSYKRSEGLFAGASLTGGIVTRDQSATMAYYDIDEEQARGYFGDETQMMKTILGTEKAEGKEEFVQKMPPSAKQLQDVLSQYVR